MGKPPSTTGKAAKITLEVLQDHFHLPMAEVAKKFDVCLTYFKRVCRSHGVNRWPYRKIKSLQFMAPHPQDVADADFRRESMAFCTAIGRVNSTLPTNQGRRHDAPIKHGQLMSAEHFAERMDDSDYAAADSNSNTSEVDEHSAASNDEPGTPNSGTKRRREEVDDGNTSAMDILVMAALGDRDSKSRRTEEPKQEPRQEPRPEFLLRPPSSFPSQPLDETKLVPSMSHLGMQFAQALASTSGSDRLPSMPPLLPTASDSVQSAGLQNYWRMVGAQMPSTNFVSMQPPRLPSFSSTPVGQQIRWS